MGSRGCPFNCAFCDKTVTGTKARYRDINDVANEMVFIEKRYRPDDIAYLDDLFTLNKNRVIALCEALKSRSLNTKWSAQGRVDSVNKEMLTAMKEAGCDELYFGVESGSDHILQFLSKNTTRDQIIRAFDLCHNVGIKPGAYMIVGVPGETKNDILEPVQYLFNNNDINASCIIARLDSRNRSQFFHSLRHFSNQPKERSTTQRLGITLKV